MRAKNEITVDWLEFKRAVAWSHAIADGEDRVLRIEGPKDLLGEFGVLIEKEGCACQFVESAETDVTLSLSSTQMQTRIHDWVSRLQEVAESIR